MICWLSAHSSNSVPDLAGLDVTTLSTLMDEIHEREERDAWSNLHEAIARVHDLLAVIRNEALMMGGVKAHNLPKLVRLPRPGEDTRPPALSPREASLFLMAG